MVLDAIISILFLAGQIVLLIIEGLLNLILLLVEGIFHLFHREKKFERFHWRKPAQETEKRPVSSVVTGTVVIVILLVAAGGWFADQISKKEVAVVASDGHPVPLALFEIKRGPGVREERTTVDGLLTIPRFGSPSLTIRDPRYIEQSWDGAELEETTLIVKRTVFGKSLDYLLEKAGD